MSDITSPQNSPLYIPDDLTVAQFMLDVHHPIRPIRPASKPWLIEDSTGREIGYEELRARTHGLANDLHNRWGIGESDAVCIFSPNHVDYVVAIWAVHRLGGIITTANPTYTADELVHQLSTTKAAVAIVHSTSLPVALAAAATVGLPPHRIVLIDGPTEGHKDHLTLNQLIASGLSKDKCYVERRLKPGEAKTKLAFLNFSSGTTGKPKAVAIPHYALIANVIQVATYCKVNEEYTSWEKRRYRPGDVVIAVLPFFHIYGLAINLHTYLFSAYSVVVVPKFNFVDMLKSIERYRINHLLLVPPMVVLFCKHPAVKKHDLSSVRFCVSGAAPMSAELTQQFVDVLPHAEIGQAFGMTETCTAVTYSRLDQKIGTLGSAGQLLPGITARVLKPDGSLAKVGEMGELVVTGPSMALYYLNDEKATQETFKDGWVHTGDEVIINAESELFVIDRIKEFLKVKGFQVAPAELEGHLLNHPDVADVCVVGVIDDYAGELPLAYVVPSEAAVARMRKSPQAADAVRASIIKYVADAKVQYKWLGGGVEFVDVIPKNPSGKLLRRVMRDRARQSRTKAAPVKGKL